MTTRRIHPRDLEYLVRLINRKLETSNCYYLSSDDDKYALHQNGSDVLRSGYLPARELYYRLSAFLDGLSAERRRDTQARRYGSNNGYTERTKTYTINPRTNANWTTSDLDQLFDLIPGVPQLPADISSTETDNA